MSREDDRREQNDGIQDAAEASAILDGEAVVYGEAGRSDIACCSKRSAAVVGSERPLKPASWPSTSSISMATI
jgi:hypothetical protein